MAMIDITPNPTYKLPDTWQVMIAMLVGRHDQGFIHHGACESNGRLLETLRLKLSGRDLENGFYKLPEESKPL
jgi:hypothetical protein